MINIFTFLGLTFQAFIIIFRAFLYCFNLKQLMAINCKNVCKTYTGTSSFDIRNGQRLYFFCLLLCSCLRRDELGKDDGQAKGKKPKHKRKFEMKKA